jgi:hypothetical protein
MIRAMVAAGETTLDADGFRVTPPGLNGSDPFSFVVIGDTGEGDASQHALRDSLIRAAGADDVGFVAATAAARISASVRRWRGQPPPTRQTGRSTRRRARSWRRSSATRRGGNGRRGSGRELGAWPSSAEWLSAMFDYNVAPCFQSFVVVTVDPAHRRLVVKPWGVNGPLTWSDFDRSATMMPAGTTAEQPVEWVASPR